MVFCNSCGTPIKKDTRGTNADGSINEDYCIECFKDGEFVEPDLTINEAIIRASKKMMEKNHRLHETEATGITNSFIPGLKRWNREKEFNQ